MIDLVYLVSIGAVFDRLVCPRDDQAAALGNARRGQALVGYCVAVGRRGHNICGLGADRRGVPGQLNDPRGWRRSSN